MDDVGPERRDRAGEVAGRAVVDELVELVGGPHHARLTEHVLHPDKVAAVLRQHGHAVPDARGLRIARQIGRADGVTAPDLRLGQHLHDLLGAADDVRRVDRAHMQNPQTGVPQPRRKRRA